MAVAKDKDSIIEDLEFMDEARVGAAEAAERAGFASAEAMEKWLERHDAYDLWLSFKARDPRGLHGEKARREQPKDNGIAALMSAAQESTRAATRRKADRVSDLIADLRQIVAAEKAEDERRKEAAAEVERLSRELAKAKARLRGGKSTTLTIASSVSAADIRKWAAENGVECPPMGRIPGTVREQYEAAS